MDGLECSETMFLSIDLGDRFDSDYYTKKYLHISELLNSVPTQKLGKLASTVASAFYPAATQLYSEGDTAFVRCVDCISYPIITNDQDEKFEKIPYEFGRENKGISFLNSNDIVITKVGTPCYASIVTDYEEVALSRTVLGLTKIHDIDPYYLMIFLRCKYGFEQLLRQRELTIQYQLTLPRVKSVEIFMAGATLQKRIREVCNLAKRIQRISNVLYTEAEQILIGQMDVPIDLRSKPIAIKQYSESFSTSGRLDAEYYQPKYDEYQSVIGNYKNGYSIIGREFTHVKEKCNRALPAYSYVEIGDIDIGTGSAVYNQITTDDLPDNAKIMTHKDDILVSTVRPNRGAVTILDKNNLLVSGAFTVLRERTTYKKEVLQVLLRSPMYRDWLLRYNVGTSYPVIKDSDVLNMPIPLLEGGVQESITDKVKKSTALRQRSKCLLDYAKQTVEMAIEQGEDVAMNWLRNKLSDAEV